MERQAAEASNRETSAAVMSGAQVGLTTQTVQGAQTSAVVQSPDRKKSIFSGPMKEVTFAEESIEKSFVEKKPPISAAPPLTRSTTSISTSRKFTDSQLDEIFACDPNQLEIWYKLDQGSSPAVFKLVPLR